MAKIDQRTQRYAASAAAVLAVACLPLADPLTSPEAAVRYAALVLQVIGFAIVMRDIFKASKAMGRPGFRDWLKGWFSSPPVNIVAGTGYGFLPLSGSASAEAGPSPNATVEERLTLLETKHTNLLKDFGHLRSQTKQDKQEVMTLVYEETAKVVRTVEEVKSNLREAQAGTLHVDTLGVVFFGLGSILSTIPGEVAAVLWWAWGIA